MNDSSSKTKGTKPPALQAVRGTHDLWPEEMRRHRRVIDTARSTAELYGYHEVAVPIFEFSDVFKRTLGDTSDVVSKEMYSFTDRGGEDLTLRPEATAGIARAVISGGRLQELPGKFFSWGPMFRYERPQKGRMRQFHQIDIELLGVAQPLGDVEVIAVGAQILRRLEVVQHCVLEINTLGDSESRNAYRSALVEYLEGHRDRLSKDSLDRLGRNPLRILDSKDEGDRRIVADAPVFSEYLNEQSRSFFAEVLAGLDAVGIPYRQNPRLVRGLDYYSHTAFEFTTEALGAQGTVLAGGRYDGLIGQMGGPATPGVGWAAGIERLSMLLADVAQPARPLAVVPASASAEKPALELAERLRRAGFAIELGYSGNLGKRMKRADKVNAAAALLLGDDELAAGTVTLRDFDSGVQEQVALSGLEQRLARYRTAEPAESGQGQP